MGIERDDKEARQDWVLRGFRQFDAPVAVITFDKELQDEDISKFDCGAECEWFSECSMVQGTRFCH